MTKLCEYGKMPIDALSFKIPMKRKYRKRHRGQKKVLLVTVRLGAGTIEFVEIG